MKITRYIFSIILMAAGCGGIFWFEQISSILGSISPDNNISPFMMLRLRIIVISLLPVGLILVFSSKIIPILKHFDSYINQVDNRNFLIRILLAAFLIRLLTQIIMPFNLWLDYSAYDELAWNLTQTGCYCIDGIPTAYRPPGYPMLLAGVYYVFGHKPILAAGFNIIFSLLIIFFSFGIARKIFSDKIARYTALILMLFPSQILFCNLLASETVFTSLLLLSIYVLPGNSNDKLILPFILSGIFLGLAALIRPIALAFWIIPILHFVINGERSRKLMLPCLIFVGLFLLTLSPWLARNYHAKSVLTISTSPGINLMAGNHPMSSFGWNPSVVEGLPIGNPNQEVFVDSVSRARAFEYIIESPGKFVKRGVMKLAYFFAVDLEGVDFHLNSAASKGNFGWYAVLGVAVQAYYYIVLLICALGLWKVIKSDKSIVKKSAIVWLPVLYWMGVHFVFYAEGRYHFPIIPMITMLAAYYLTYRVENEVYE